MEHDDATTWTPPPEGYTTTPCCPACGTDVTLPAEQLDDVPLGPCGGCGDELVARRDAMGLMVKGSAWRALVDAAIGAELAARGKCPRCKRLVRVTADGTLQAHLVASTGKGCLGSGGQPERSAAGHPA
jgi:hypothetical protein